MKACLILLQIDELRSIRNRSLNIFVCLENKRVLFKTQEDFNFINSTCLKRSSVRTVGKNSSQESILESRMSFHQQYPHSGEGASLLAPGFHFHPTDEELVSYYLTQKVANSNSIFEAIGEVDFNKFEPWQLPGMAGVGDQSMYYFSLKDRKYPTGKRTNRATRAGYWKSTGRDREVISRRTGRLLGMKKTLVFYTGRAPKLGRTNWIMHEYRLQDESTSHQKQRVVCKVFEKKVLNKRAAASNSNDRGYNAECSTEQPFSFSSALPNLESPSSNFVKPNNLSEPQGYFHGVTPGVTFLAGPEAILKQSDATLKVRPDFDLGDTLENLVSGWDMGTPVPIWDVSGGPSSISID